MVGLVWEDGDAVDLFFCVDMVHGHVWRRCAARTSARALAHGHGPPDSRRRRGRTTCCSEWTAAEYTQPLGHSTVLQLFPFSWAMRTHFF